jgi:hypothetical protein
MGQKKKSLTLREFIDQIGPNKLAMTLNVSKQTVSLWYNLQTAPKPLTAGQIIELSYGLVSWESIYKPYVDMNSGAK